MKYTIKLPIWAIVEVEFIDKKNLPDEDIIENAIKLAHERTKLIDWGYDEMAMDPDEMISTSEE